MTEIVIGTGTGRDGRDKEITIDLGRLCDGRFLVQGVSRTGKSWLLRRLLEQAWGHVQEIVLDLEGEYVTLAETFGHVLLDAEDIARAGAGQVARAAREHRISLIADLSQADRDEQARLATDFLRGLVDVSDEHWHSALVVVDEAHLLAPQGASSGTPEHLRRPAVAALTDLMARGSKRGLIGVVATQRLAKIAKSVIAEAGNVAIGRNTMDLDVRRAASILGLPPGAAELRLRRLYAGEFMVLGDAIADIPTRVKIGPVESDHRGRTPDIKAPPTLDPDEAEAVFAGLPDAEEEEPEGDQSPEGARPGIDHWSDEEKAIVEAGYSEGLTRGEIRKRLPDPWKRTLSAIGYIAGELGLNKAPPVWSEEEVETLRGMAGEGKTPREIAAALGRPLAGVHNAAHKQSIQFRRPWEPDEYELLRTRHAEGARLVDIARELGRPYVNVAKVANNYSLSFKASGQPNRHAKANKPARISAEQLIALARESHDIVETAAGSYLVDGRYSYSPEQLVALVNRDRAKRSEGPVAVAPTSAEPPIDDNDAGRTRPAAPEFQDRKFARAMAGQQFEDDPRAVAEASGRAVAVRARRA